MFDPLQGDRLYIGMPGGFFPYGLKQDARIAGAFQRPVAGRPDGRPGGKGDGKKEISEGRTMQEWQHTRDGAAVNSNHHFRFQLIWEAGECRVP